jgi:hypothetical protein
LRGLIDKFPLPCRSEAVRCGRNDTSPKAWNGNTVHRAVSHAGIADFARIAVRGEWKRDPERHGMAD